MNLVQGLAANRDGNEYVLFVTSQNEHLFADSRFERVRVTAGGSRVLRIVVDQLLVPFMARRRGAEILHYPGTVGSAVSIGRLQQVVTVHYDIDAAHAQSVSWARRLYYTWFMKQTRKAAAALIVPSRDFATKFGRHWDVAPEKLHVVHHGVRASDSDDADAVLNRIGVQSPFLLSVTNALPHKNTVGLVLAFAELAAVRGGDVPSLVLAGQISDADLARWTTESAARGIPLPPRKIVRTGYVSAAELDVLYRRAELLVLTTLTESSSMPVIEAMARGCPVVASDIDVHREIGADAAVFVDAQSTEAIVAGIQRVLDDRERRSDLAQAGLRRAQKFTWEDCARKTAAVYEHVANG